MTDEKYLELVPKRICESEINDSLVTILYIKKPTFIEKMFFRKLINKPHKIDLDEIGSFIWEEINASISVKEIIKLAKEKFDEKIEPAENRVVQFIRQMHSTKLIMLFEKQVSDK
ncbi:MAG: PqqD family protein [Bacteroidetes bacterium]|nr:PqqD family protein [Bacteroidota bacterium]MBU1116535.1 PqqD family protein [Bacteroidota bacterium]MBU1796845.1 PqqD family protein [Bacteroidota bacterium]